MKNRCKLPLRQHIDRWMFNGSWSQIIAVIFLSVFVFFIFAPLFILCFGDYIGIRDADEQVHSSKLWLLYYFFADPGNQMSGDWVNDSSRWIGLIISTLGSIFLSGLLISTITNVFERRADRWQSGFSYYKLKDHIVIIGSDQMVYGLVNQLCENTTSQIVVMTSTDVEHMRNSLYATLKEDSYQKRIIINYGQRDSEKYYALINVAFAKEVYILGDTSEFDEIENIHDSLNVKCLTIIAKLCEKNGRKGLPCNVLFNYKTTYHIFQYADLPSQITDYIEFHPFNFYDFWARKVLVARFSKEENINYKPLDYIPITSRESDKFVHLIIIGMSQMGEAMALQAAHIAHFPNYRKRKTKITFIDRNGKVEMAEFKQKCGELFKVSRSTYIDADAWCEAEENQHTTEPLANYDKYTVNYGLANEYRHLVNINDDDKEFIDVEWEFIKGDDNNPIVQELLERYVSDKNAIITVAVCLNLTHISLRSAMHLPKTYYEKNIPILVQQRKTSTIVSTLNGKDREPIEQEKLLYKNIIPFGMVYDCYDLHLASSVEICKRIAAVYDHYFTYEDIPTYIDPVRANQLWSKTVISKRWSNIFAAASIPTKLRCINIDWDINSQCHISKLTDDEVSLLSEIEHNRWNIEELLLGYRPVKQDEDKIIDQDKSKKKFYKNCFIHYDIRPYSELKTDDQGRKANQYDEVLVKSLPLILNCQKDKN